MANVVVIDAEGHFGTAATVWYVGSIEKCRAFAKSGGCRIIAGCHHEQGEKIMSGVLTHMLASGQWREAK